MNNEKIRYKFNKTNEFIKYEYRLFDKFDRRNKYECIKKNSSLNANIERKIK